MSEEPKRSKDLATAIPTATLTSEEVGQMFQDYHALVFRAAYRVTGNAGDAEDVLQTVFLRLLRRTSEDVLASPESYLRRAAVNAALDRLRSRQTAPSIALEDADPLPARSSDAPDRALASSEIRAWLRETVARLTPRVAEMFTLRFYGGLSNPEIARVMETTESTVAVTLCRVRDRIYKEYQAFTGGVHESRKQ